MPGGGHGGGGAGQAFAAGGGRFWGGVGWGLWGGGVGALGVLLGRGGGVVSRGVGGLWGLGAGFETRAKLHARLHRTLGMTL